MIKGSKIYLRALEPSDLNFLYNLENKPENWLISHTQIPYSKHILAQYIHSTEDIYTTKQVRFVICKLNHTPIGTIDIFDFNPQHQRAGLGIIITEKERNKGFAKEALELTVNYCFSILLLKNIYCNILEDNTASKKLFENMGFNLIGIKKNWINSVDGWKNESFYQLFNF